MKYYKIVFSPTGGTAHVADAITEKWIDTETIDLSDASMPFSDLVIEADSLVLIAMPSFGGVAPQLALDRLSKLNGNGAKCAIAAVYGNRAYDDTLVQMQDYAVNAGFQVIAAVSAVAEHSIIHQYAAGRPDSNDCRQLSEFGERIIQAFSVEKPSISIPGNRPYKKAGVSMVPNFGNKEVTLGGRIVNCTAIAITSVN